jgi:hypothetical protein
VGGKGMVAITVNARPTRQDLERKAVVPGRRTTGRAERGSDGAVGRLVEEPDPVRRMQGELAAGQLPILERVSARAARRGLVRGRIARIAEYVGEERLNLEDVCTGRLRKPCDHALQADPDHHIHHVRARQPRPQ